MAGGSAFTCVLPSRERLLGWVSVNIPQKLPTSQNQQIRLYKRGTQVGELLQLVLTPGEQKDMELVERFSGQVPDYGAIVQRIRELVAE